MAPSASKQKRLAEKAAKKNAGIDDSSTSTPTGSTNGASTPLTSVSGLNSGVNSKTASQEDILSMAKLNIATDRCVNFSGMLI
jgi:ATP-binding cassette subfamily F protein 2